MIFQIAGKRYQIDREQILRATENVRPNAFDRRNKYYVSLHGAKFPIKQPVHLATGLAYIEFTAQHAHRILTSLGFHVAQLASPNTEPPQRTLPGQDTVRLAVVVERDEDGYVVASCPALPGCHSQGRTKEEALSNIREAIRGYIASMRKHGEPLPNTTEVEEVEVPV